MKTRSIITILVLMAVIAAHQTASADTPSTTTSPALDPAYLKEMPSIDRVKKDMKVDDAKMTIARQAAALDYLHVIVAEMAGERAENDQLTADEKRLIDGYLAGVSDILKSLGDDAFTRLPYLSMINGVGSNPRFQDYLLNKYFSAGFLDEYAKVNADFNARRQKASAPATAPAAAPGKTDQP